MTESVRRVTVIRFADYSDVIAPGNSITSLRCQKTARINSRHSRRFIDNLRRYKSRRLALVDDPVVSADPDQAPAAEASTEDLVEGEFTINRVLVALDQLSEDHQLVIKLHDVEGYTLAEMVEITGIPLGTLKSRRQRARERLQNLLDDGPESPKPASEQDIGEKNDELRPVPTEPGPVS